MDSTHWMKLEKNFKEGGVTTQGKLVVCSRIFPSGSRCSDAYEEGHDSLGSLSPLLQASLLKA